MSFYIHESSYVEDNVHIADNVKIEVDFVCNNCKRKYKLENNVLKYGGYLKAIPDACIGCVA